MAVAKPPRPRLARAAWVGVPLLVVAIALAVLGRPALRAFEARRARHRAVSTLEHLLAQQKQFKDRLDEFLTVGPAGVELGGAAMPWVAEACPATCRRLAIEACSTFGCLDFAPPSPVHHRYGCRAQRSGDAYDVTCAAAADLDGDGVVSLLVVGTSTAGFLHAPLPVLDPRVEPGRCARIDDVPADVVYDCTPGAL